MKEKIIYLPIFIAIVSIFVFSFAVKGTDDPAGPTILFFYILYPVSTFLAGFIRNKEGDGMFNKILFILACVVVPNLLIFLATGDRDIVGNLPIASITSVAGILGVIIGTKACDE